MFHWICLLFIFLVLVGVELPLCLVVMLSQDAMHDLFSEAKLSITLFGFISGLDTQVD